MDARRPVSQRFISVEVCICISYLSDELDIGAVLKEAEVCPALDHLVHLAGGLPALHRVVAAIRAGGQQILGQRVIMLEQEANPKTEQDIVLELDNMRQSTCGCASIGARC